MKVNTLHSWEVSVAEAQHIQRQLREQLILEDKKIPETIRTVAGADISYARGETLLFAAVVVLKLPELTLIEESSYAGRVNFPYIPGFLTFREGPILIKAFEKLQQTPDVVIFDGQGIAHPRGMGLASHLGLFLDIPTIGCAKKKLVGSFDEAGEEPGNFSYLIYKDHIIGAVLRTRKNVKPVFVSQGHKISLSRALSIVESSLGRYRLPEPTRQAHLLVNKLRLEYYNSHKDDQLSGLNSDTTV